LAIWLHESSNLRARFRRSPRVDLLKSLAVLASTRFSVAESARILH
jgi:hypothetical protein